MSQRLLVVEDSKPIATVIKQIAQSLNFTVVIATTLAQVEEVLAGDNNFFAATVDYALPDASDGEAIACVLSHGIPSVVMTGKMDDATRQKILAQPVIDYIPKENSQAFLYLKRILHWQKTNSGNGILVVDDSSAARNHIVELLKRRNFSVYIANDGIQALEVLEKNGHTVIPFSMKSDKNLPTRYDRFFVDEVNFQNPIYYWRLEPLNYQTFYYR